MADLKGLSPRQRDLLLRRLTQAKGSAPAAEREHIPRQPRAARESSFPLSFAQRRLWFLDRLEPGSPLYNVTAAFEVAGPLDVAALEASLREVVRRHEALRTTFADGPGGPAQVIHPQGEPAFAVSDLRSLPEGERRTEAWRQALAEARRPFDLTRGPLLRALLLREDERAHLAVLTVHHIVSDGWSMGVLVREVAALYPAFAAGGASPLPELPVQYADFSVWQREWLTGGALDAQLAFWRERLAGAPVALELPTDRPRPAVQTVRGGQVPVRLAPSLVAALRETARREGGTLFMVILAAFELLLQRYAGQDDLLIGSPIAGRNRPEIEGLIGFFVNTLVMRGNLRGEPTFAELLARVGETALAAYAHQDLPFERLIEELHPQRDLSRPPLVQVMFTLQRAEAEALDLPGLRLAPCDLDSGTAKLELTLHLAEGTESVAGWIEHNSDLYDAATVERMVEQLVSLLEGVPEGLGRRAADLPLLPEGQLRELLAVADGGPGEPLEAECLHRLFEIQALRSPDAPAVEAGGERWTYGELDRRANRLAHHLRSLGVGPEVTVALCMAKTPRRLAAVLAILKAGGAYVPLDPAYPAARLAFMLEDSATPLLLTERELLPSLPVREGVLLLDGEWPGTPDQEAAGPPDQVTGGNLAYVIYTSGSTGRPKGVLSCHLGACRMAADAVRRLRLGPGSRVPHNASLSFDPSVFELFPALAAGAELVFFPSGLMGADLAAELRRHGITSMVFTSPVLLETLGHEEIPSLRVAGFGAEPCPPEVAAHWSSVLELYNCYGPTETTVYSTAARCRPGKRESPPIGRPIAGTRTYVLDRRMRPAPLGMAGEILVGGEGLARGYLGRPDLTAERFVPDPSSGLSGARLYRTGDLGRWRVDGELEFVGRKDAQVKIRGFRIELGEVEAVLHRHPAVERAVAMARQDVPGIQRLVVYAVPKPGEAPTGAGLREFLKESLPEFMVPSAVVVLPSLPLTTNDKVDFKALPAPEGTSEAAAGYVMPRNDAERRIAEVWREVLRVERVGADDNFFDLGGHSLLMARVHSRLGEVFPGFGLGLVDLFKYPTIGALAARLSSESEEVPAARTGVARALARRGRAERAGAGIAIVGMACRFPGAESVERFWEHLIGGVESITFFTDEQLRAAGVPASDLSNPKYVRARGIVEGAAEFDAGFFGYSPREAEVMDPQQRVFLECAWETFEDAGIDPARFPGDVGVFAGVGMNTYVFNLLADPEIRDSVGSFQVSIANDKDFLASRVSYKLGLRGPSLSVQTACSTSLVAAHLACQSLLSGECDAALAGGVSIRLPQETGHHHHAGAVFSPDGHCRAFDSRAGGFVGGNGAGAVLLKRLEDALRDGDPIHAVIRGSAVNNDGALKVGYTAPGVDGQAQVIAQALAVAEVPSETVGYVEAHGTGTDLGDPIEIAALTQAFGPGVPPESCAIGSAKTNIGHLDSAAGVAGLIKAALILEHGRIPPSLNFETPNPRLELEKTPFRVNHRLTEWPAGPSPRRAGVSSMGIGGTNAHVVLEEPPARAASGRGRDWEVLPLSARSEGALAAAVDRLAAHLRRHPEIGLADAAWTLQTGRRRFEQRAFALAADAGQVAAALESHDPERFVAGTGDARSVAFLFSGQGAQYPGMAAGLYRSEPVFREAVDSACEQLAPRLGLDLRTLLFPAGGEGEAAAVELSRTEITQPALFVIEHALARLWISWGVWPQAMIGHSVGEYVAACLAGVFSLEDALDLIAERGRLMGEMERGAMLAVQLSEAEVATLLGPGLSIAAVNAPARTVVAGAREAVEALEAELETRGVRHRRLRTSHAFHSEMMEPALEPFIQALRRVRLRPPSIPFLSNVTGTWITGQEATDPGYWARHLRRTVRFADGITELLREPGRALLEVGPGNSLTTLARETGAPVAVTSLPHAADRRPDAEHALMALGRLWIAGIEIDWQAFHADERRLRVPLPAYAFEHRRYWIEGPGPLGTGAAVRPDLSKRSDLSEWLYAPTWRRALEPARPAFRDGERWLVLDAWGIGERLRREGREVVTAEPGEDLATLIADLRATGRMPSRIVHLWSLLSDSFESAQELGFRSVIRLAQALGEGSEAVDLCVVTAGLFEVTGGEDLRPERATLLGPARVLPWELPRISCRVVDAEPSEDADRLLREIEAAGSPLVALRGRHRWMPEWEPVRLDEAAAQSPRIRDDGVYVVTGGLGGVGSELATALARGRRVHLALLGRTGLPSREEWPARSFGDDPVALRIRRAMALEELGAQVLPLAADVTDRGSLEGALEEVRRRFGAIHGAVHAAGAPGGGLIQRKTAEESKRGLAARVQGLLLLEELLGSESLDFLVLTSSLGALFGEPGQVDLCAACAFFDARAQARRPGAPVLAIDWDTWRDVGMVADIRGLPEELRRVREQALATGIAPAEGREIFARVLESSGLSQVVVSTRDLGAVARHLRDLARGGAAAAGAAPVRATYARPDLRSAYEAPRDETEAAIAAIWQELLGIERVGVHDNFFDLGGHSLLATQVMSRLRETLGASLPLEALFEAPTVGGLAERLAATRTDATEDGEDLEALLREIESLSADEARALYAEESNERV